MPHKKRLYPIIVMILLIGCIPTAEVTSGKKDLSYLEEADTVLLEFDYSELTISGYGSEEEFLDVVGIPRGEQGKGFEDSREYWEHVKRKTIEPIFQSTFNGYLEEFGLVASDEAKATSYKAIVRMDLFDLGYTKGLIDVGEPGWEDQKNRALEGVPAEIYGGMVVKKSENGKKLIELKVEDARGSEGISFRNRLYGASATFARRFGRFFEDQLEKEG